MGEKKLPVQFSGESPWDAIVNHYGLDIIEEQEFLGFCIENNVSQNADLETLHQTYIAYKEPLNSVN